MANHFITIILSNTVLYTADNTPALPETLEIQSILMRKCVEPALWMYSAYFPDLPADPCRW